jgi:predicted nuclease of predicted toxin-antitoxin system
VRFLVDECLSLELVTVAAEAGYEAHHIAHVGKAGWKDWNVVRHARENNFVLVTNNAADFRKLYAEESLHAGLVVLIPNVPTNLQRRLFKRAVAKLTEFGEPINHVLEVDIDGEDVIFDLYEMPPTSSPAKRGICWREDPTMDQEKWKPRATHTTGLPLGR